MKTKKEVYVVVDTPKKAKKLKNVLDMFGEETYNETNKRLHDGVVSEEYPTVHLGYFGWCGCKNDSFIDKQKVSIKKLRNILAVEHLKEGDVVVIENEIGTKWAVKLTGGKYLEHSLSYNIGDGFFNNYTMPASSCKFIRYATEEEKELLRVKSLQSQAKDVLKPVKKELEVGKWYNFKNPSDNRFGLDKQIFPALLYLSSKETAYGFSFGGTWTNKFCTENHLDLIDSEATPQEVEKALIEEAKKRYKVGDKISYDSVEYTLDFKSILYLAKTNQLFMSVDNEGRSIQLFKNGQWATIIEQDKFAELKEAHKNGAVIEFKNGRAVWEDCIDNHPKWYLSCEYRIKPEEKPKVGDICKFWNDNQDNFIIGKLKCIYNFDNNPYTTTNSAWKNAKKVTEQEVIQLLFK